MSHRRLLGALVLGTGVVCATTAAISQNWPQSFFEEQEKKRAEAARAAEKARRERAAEQARAAAAAERAAEQQKRAQAVERSKPKDRPAEAKSGASTEARSAKEVRQRRDLPEAREPKDDSKAKQAKEAGAPTEPKTAKQASEAEKAAAAKPSAAPADPAPTPSHSAAEKQAGAANPATAAAGQAAGAAAKSAPGDLVEKELERYRAMLSDPFANPGLLFVDRGEQHWKTLAGPKNASLEACDLGKGAGTLEGAYAELPRFFADAGRVLDLEGRLLWCMEKLQGRDPKEILKTKFSTAEKTSELEDLTAFVANKSNGQKLAVKLDHAKEKEAYAVGEVLFHRRQGPWDFACATCHEYEGKRIRLQNLPTFNDPKQAGAVMGTWPAYRVSQNTVRTMQHRLYDCFWQMRLPAVDYASDVTIALTTYLAKKGEGGVIEAPSIKR
jgi:sulfur-oxidizing protein SoxA